MPLVSIGLPVYNGQNYLKQTIESICNQSFVDFELIICNNSSTDNTEQICLDLKNKDNRIIYKCNKSNIGAAGNFNLSFHLAKGKYFKWAAHDDLLAPDYLKKCVNILEDDPNIVLCHSNILWIDEHNNIIKSKGTEVMSIGSENPVKRFKGFIATNHGCFDVFGVYRRDILEKTKLIQSYIASDRVLLAEVSLYGKVQRVNENLFYSRDHLKRAIRMENYYSQGKWWDSTNTRFPMPWCSYIKEMFRIIKKAPISLKHKLLCYLHIPVRIVKLRKKILVEIFNFIRLLFKRSKE